MNKLRQQAESQRVWAESPSCHSGGQAITNNEYEAMRKQNTLGYEKPQREWVSLTDDDIRKGGQLGIYETPLMDFARAIEALCKEKNT